MINQNEENSILLELRAKALKLFIENPLNEEVIKVFNETFNLGILKESEVDIFGAEFNPEELEKFISTKNIVQKNIIDIPFGFKVSLCFGSLTPAIQGVVAKFEAGQPEEMIKIFEPECYENHLIYLKQKGIGGIGGGQKTGDLQLKYTGAKKDYDIETSKKYQETSKMPACYKNFGYDEETGKFSVSQMTADFRTKWASGNRSKMGQSVSSDVINGTITDTGAGQLEFLARMYYAAIKGMDQTLPIPSKISTSENGIDAETTRLQETFLLNLDDGALRAKIADRCRQTLAKYLTAAVKHILAPIIRYPRIEDYAYEGIERALNAVVGIPNKPCGNPDKKVEKEEENTNDKYNFENANIAAWAFQVTKNCSIDKLKKDFYYKFDLNSAINWSTGQSYPFSLWSKIPHGTSDNKGSFVKIVDKNTNQPITKKSSDGSVIFYKYKYKNENDLLRDLFRANGYDENVESNCAKTEDQLGAPERERKNAPGAGRPQIYVPCSPVYYKNVDLNTRKNFMNLVPKLDTADLYNQTQEEEEELAARNSQQGTPEETRIYSEVTYKIRKILEDIYTKIINADKTDDGEYGQSTISSIMKENKDVIIRIMFNLLNYGVYQLDKDNYTWRSNPEKYLDNFVKDIKDNFPKGKNLPSSLRSKPSKKFPEGKEFKISYVISQIRKVLLGSGTEGPEMSALFRGDKEKFASSSSSKGFLIKNPNYLVALYNLLQQLPTQRVLGRSEPTKFDENTKNISSLISEIKNEINNYEKQILKNLKKTWKI